MTPEEVLDVWRRLRAGRPVSEDQIASAPIEKGGVSSGILLAVDVAGDLHLLIPAAGAATRQLPPDFNGPRLRERRLDGEICLDLYSPATHEVMFATLCGQLAEAVLTNGREPWAAAVSIVRNWQSAWRPLRPPMPRTVQIGLTGELFMLRELWLPALGSEAVHFWSGPDQERHDFTGPHVHMEVKTTTRSRHEHEISRADQLNVVPGRDLIFASVQLEESTGGQQSLATLVDDTINAIRKDPAAIDGFLTRLNALGWSDDMRRSPELLRFNLRSAQLFAVDDEFPRLPDTFMLPQGVVSLRYTISLANIPMLDHLAVRQSIALNLI